MKIDYGFFKISTWSQVPQGLCTKSIFLNVDSKY